MSGLGYATRHFGVSLGHAGAAEAEGWVRSLGVPEAVEVCIHRARAPYEHVALSIALPAGTVMELPPMDGRFAAAAMRACTAHASSFQ